MNDLEQRELPGNTIKSSNRRSSRVGRKRESESKKRERKQKKGQGVAVGYKSCLPEHFWILFG
jgi:hypothetical protein